MVDIVSARSLNSYPIEIESNYPKEKHTVKIVQTQTQTHPACVYVKWEKLKIRPIGSTVCDCNVWKKVYNKIVKLCEGEYFFLYVQIVCVILYTVRPFFSI